MSINLGSNISPPSALAYEGVVAVPFIMRTFSPLTTFNQFPVPTIWINTSSSNAYILVSKALGVAIWVSLGGAAGAIDTITTPDSVVVVPTAGNINFLQSGSISITGSGSNVSFNVMGGGLTWVEILGTTQSMAINTGYVASNGSLITATLPVTAAFGSIIELVGKGAGGWIIAQNAGQTIHYGNQSTTTGVAGSLASGQFRDAVRLVCTTANTDFTVLSSIGNQTVV